MRNISIERPTTLIRISKHDYEEMIVEKTHFSKKLDFYKMEDEKFLDIDFDDSIMFNNFNSDIRGKMESSLYEEMPFKNQIDGFFVNGIFYDRSISKNTDKVDILFVLSTLKFDLRVKFYEVGRENIFVYFFSENDAVSFYRQYFNFFELSFQQFCNWSPVPSDTFLEIEPTIVYSRREKPKEVILPIPLKNDILYGRKRFIDTVDYYNNLKTGLTKNDLQKITDDLANGITDFVYINTKELAVGSKSNKIMQNAIKIMSGEEIDRLFDFLEYDIVPISATKHGAYTVQTLLNFSTNVSHRKLISKYFAKEGEFLLAHDIGNYTFQKLLVFDENLVRKFFVDNFKDVANSDLGLKVFKRCVEHLGPCKDDLMKKVESFDLPSGLALQLKQIISNL